ncbi:hypothetical protein [Sphingobacterium tabacisoli]|uniref:Lipoprotein n=1 Tax=Sphingobacterium tabacisoli TaxID=2044855 RepID=A0ABW5L592_9SPHI|nr:hypothetical protein [Sphingobacterium tabacisoli]
MKKLVVVILMLSVITFFHSCSLVGREDRNPEVSTLEELIAVNKVLQVEERDSAVMHTLAMLTDSLYYSKRQLSVFQPVAIEEDHKTPANYTVKNEIRIKNVYNGKTYLSDTVGSASTILMDKSRNIIVNNVLYVAPSYSKKKILDSASIGNAFTDMEQQSIKLEQELPEFDESIVYRWTNGRIPSFHKMFYYELEGQKFKSLGNECYRINSSPKYFYQARFGILKMK